MHIELKKIYNLIWKYSPVLIVVCTFFLRAFKGPELFFWNIDEDIVGLTVRRMLVEHRPQLIGFPIPGGINLGPLFYYLTSIPYLLSNFNPERFFIFSATFSALTAFLIYKVGSVILRKSIGLVASIIYAFSYFATTYGRLLTGLTLGPILALLVYFFIWQNLKYKRPTNLFFLGLVLLAAVQNEGSSFSLVALFATVWLIYSIKIPRSVIIKICSLFVLFHLPLLIFDLRHNFHITKSFLGFFNRPGTVSGDFSVQSFLNILQVFPNTLSRLLYPTGNLSTSEQILPCSDLTAQRVTSIPIFVYVASIFVIGFFLTTFISRKNRTIGEKIIFIHLFIALLGIILFNFFLTGYLFEWILVIFVPAFCLMSAFVFMELFKRGIVLKILLSLALILFVFVNVKATLNSSDAFGLRAKSEAVKYASEKVNGRKFHLESTGSCFPTGYMYLFWFHKNFPTTSNADDIFSGTYYKRNSEIPDLTVVIANPSESEDEDYFEKYISYKRRATESRQIGAIEVMIVEDSK